MLANFVIRVQAPAAAISHTGERRSPRRRRHHDGLGDDGPPSIHATDRQDRPAKRRAGADFSGPATGRTGGKRRRRIPEQYARSASDGVGPKPESDCELRTEDVQVYRRVLPQPSRRRGRGITAVCGRRLCRLQDAQYRGVSQSHAGDPRNHRAGAGPFRRRDGALLHPAHGDRALFHARHRHHSLHFVLRPVVCARHLQIWRGLLLRRRAGIGGDAAERELARRSRSYDPSEQLHRRNLSLSGGGPAAFWNHQSTHGAGLDRGAPALDHSGHRRGEQLGRPYQGVRSRSRSAQARSLQRHRAANPDGAGQLEHQCRRARNLHRPAVHQHPRRRPDRRRRKRRSRPRATRSATSKTWSWPKAMAFPFW